MKFVAPAFALLLICSAAIADDYELPWSLADAGFHEIESETIGHELHIWVRKPFGYDEGDGAHYPTVYVLDGGGVYPLIAGYSVYLEVGEEMPPSIIVGIGYPGIRFEDGNFRSTDYTVPSEERDYYGGAEKFQTFLAEELIPLIESNYRSDGDRRIIFGQSLGGQFVLFTAQTRPELFWGHIASNPALHRNLEYFLTTTPEMSNSRLFVASGEFDAERYKVPANDWIEHWRNVADKPWQFEAIELEGHTHVSALPASFRLGMHWLFGIGQ